MSDEALHAANALYRTALFASCRCATKWEAGIRVLVSRCQRCASLEGWEAVQGLPESNRAEHYLPAAKPKEIS